MGSENPSPGPSCQLESVRIGAGFNPVFHKKGMVFSSETKNSNMLPLRTVKTPFPTSEGDHSGIAVKTHVEFQEKFVEDGLRVELSQSSPMPLKGWSYQFEDPYRAVFWPSDGYCLFKVATAYQTFLGIEPSLKDWYHSTDIFGANEILSRLPPSKRLRVVLAKTGENLFHVGLEVKVGEYNPDKKAKLASELPEVKEKKAEEKKDELRATKLTNKIQVKEAKLNALRTEYERVEREMKSQKTIIPLNKMATVAMSGALERKRRTLLNRYRQAVGDHASCDYCRDASKLLLVTTMLNTMRRGLVNNDLIDYAEKVEKVCLNCAAYTCGPVLFDKPLFQKLEKFGLTEVKTKEVRATKARLSGWKETLSKKLQAQGIIGNFFQNSPKLLAHASAVTGGKPSEYFMCNASDSEHAGSRTLANVYQSEMLGTERNTLYVDVQSKYINTLETIKNLFTFQPNYEAPAQAPQRVRNQIPVGAAYLCYRQNVTLVDSQYMRQNAEAGLLRVNQLVALGIDVTLANMRPNHPAAEASKTQGFFQLQDLRAVIDAILMRRAADARPIQHIVFCFADMHWYLDTRRWNDFFDGFNSVTTSIVAVGMDFPAQNGFYYIGDGEGTVEIDEGSVVFHARGNGDPYVHPNVDIGLAMADATQMTPHGRDLSINYGRWIGSRFSAEVKMSRRSTPQIPQVVNFLSKDLTVKDKVVVPQLRAEVAKGITGQIMSAAVRLERMEDYDNLPRFVTWTLVHLLYVRWFGRLPNGTADPKDLERLRQMVLMQGLGIYKSRAHQRRMVFVVTCFGYVFIQTLKYLIFREAGLLWLYQTLFPSTASYIYNIAQIVVGLCGVPYLGGIFQALLLRELIVLVLLVVLHFESREVGKLMFTTTETFSRNGVDKMLFAGAGEPCQSFFVRKPKSEVKPINRNNRAFISAQYYNLQRQVSEEEFLNLAEEHDLKGENGPRAPIQTGFDFETPNGTVQSYAYDHTSIVNLLHALSNRIFRPNTGVDPEWLHQLNLVTEDEFAALEKKITRDFIEKNWESPEDLLEGKKGFGDTKKQVYQDAVDSQRRGEMGQKYYTGFVKAYETYANPKNLRGNVIYGDKKRARIVENRPQIAAGIPWVISNWMNQTLGTLVPEYSYRASEKKLSEFLEARKKSNEVHTLSTDFGAMDSTVYHETQEAVERKLLRILTPRLTQRLAEFGFPREAIDQSLKWMTAAVKTTKFFTKIGKIVVKRRGGRASGDPSTTWGNTLTTIMFAKTCMRRAGVRVTGKVSGDDLTVFSASRDEILALRDVMLNMTSRSPDDDGVHSGFVIDPEECVLDINRATFCSKTLHVAEAAVIPKLTNFYFNSRLYTGSNSEILKNWRIHRYAVALSRLLAAGSSQILQDYALQMVKDMWVFKSSAEAVTHLTKFVAEKKIDYFKMFGDFWEEQEVHHSDDVDYLVAREAKAEKINLDVMLEQPDLNVKYYLLAGTRSHNAGVQRTYGTQTTLVQQSTAESADSNKNAS